MKTKAKAILFIGFRHKKEAVLTAKAEGYTVILLTRKADPITHELFDQVIEDNILSTEVMDRIIPDLKNVYRIKGIISNYEHYVVPRSYLAERFSLPSCSVYSACCTRSKAMQRNALKFMSENIDFRIVKTERQALNAFKSLGKNIFLKSIAGIKSRYIFHVESEKELIDSYKKITSQSKELDEDLYNDFNYCDFNFHYPDPKSTFLVEKAEKGRQITISSLAANLTIWHAPSACDIYTAEHINRNDSFLAFRILPSNLPKEIIKKAKLATETASKILGLRYCPVFCELIVTEKQEIKLIEIASRMGGYRPLMYRHAYKIDLNKLLIESVIGKELKTRKKAERHVSMVEIFPEKEGRLKQIVNLEKLTADSEVSEIEVLAQKGDKVGFAKNNYPPVLRFLITTDSYEKAYQKSVDYHKSLKVSIQ